MVIGMTVVLGKVMPWKGKVAIGMTAAALHTPKRKKQEMTCAEPPPRRLQTAVSHTSKRKKQEIACAEPPLPAQNCRVAHAKKKKARNDVCGAAPAGSKLSYRTRQKGKSKK